MFRVAFPRQSSASVEHTQDGILVNNQTSICNFNFDKYTDDNWQDSKSSSGKSGDLIENGGCRRNQPTTTVNGRITKEAPRVSLFGFGNNLAKKEDQAMHPPFLL